MPFSSCTVGHLSFGQIITGSPVAVDLEMAERQRKRHTQPPPMGSTWGGKRKRDEHEQDLNKFQRLVKKAFVSDWFLPFDRKLIG